MLHNWNSEKMGVQRYVLGIN